MSEENTPVVEEDVDVAETESTDEVADPSEPSDETPEETSDEAGA